MKVLRRIVTSVMIFALLAAVLVLPTAADGISLEQETEYGLVEDLDFGSSGVYTSLTCQNTEKSRESFGGISWCSLRFGDRDAYVYSTRYLQNTYEDCPYVVIRYASNAPVRMTWVSTITGETYSVELPTQTETATVLIQMQRHAGWNGKIETLGFAAVQDETSIILQWLKVYTRNPYELYGETTVVLFPEYSLSTQTKPVPETETEPSVSVDTAWESFETQQVTDILPKEEQTTERDRGGLFFEVFGDDALPGCQGQPLGCKSGGCKSGGCHAVAGGLLAFCLLAAGLVFRKKE